MASINVYDASVEVAVPKGQIVVGDFGCGKESSFGLRLRIGERSIYERWWGLLTVSHVSADVARDSAQTKYTAIIEVEEGGRVGIVCCWLESNNDVNLDVNLDVNWEGMPRKPHRGKLHLRWVYPMLDLMEYKITEDRGDQ